MRTAVAIVIGSLWAAGTALATPQTPAPGGSPGSDQQGVVNTAKWGFEAPGLFALDPQQVHAQGGSLRPGPRNTLRSSPHGGLVSAVDRSGTPGRE